MNPDWNKEAIEHPKMFAVPPITENTPKWTDSDMCKFVDWIEEFYSPYQDITQTTILDLGWHRDIVSNNFYRTAELLQRFIEYKHITKNKG